jgi:hypothetical protein
VELECAWNFALVELVVIVMINAVYFLLFDCSDVLEMLIKWEQAWQLMSSLYVTKQKSLSMSWFYSRRTLHARLLDPTTRCLSAGVTNQ